jgi:hypothetical protein
MMKDRLITRMSSRQKLGLGAVALLGLGFAGGAGAVSLTRPPVSMAPSVPTPVARLANARGIVTVKGRVADVYGDRFVVQDATGRALVAAGHDGATALTVGAPVQVQGRFEDGQLRARYLVNAAGEVEEVGPPRPPSRPHDRDGRDGPHGPGGPHDGPPPPPRPGDAPPPPPAGRPGAPGVAGPDGAAPPPPPVASERGQVPPPPVVGRPVAPAATPPLPGN